MIKKVRMLLKNLKGEFCRILRGRRDLRDLMNGVRYDTAMYRRFSLFGKNRKEPTITSLESQIIKQYHGFEKGLTMPSFKPGSSSYNIKTLLGLLDRFCKQGGNAENIHFQTAIRCLERYLEVHQELGINVEDKLGIAIQDFLLGYQNQPNSSSPVFGGDLAITPEELFRFCDSSFDEFFPSRRSSRKFDENTKISSITLKKCVELAIRTPSVCNRQTWRVHFYQERRKIDQLLSFQNGNRGFGHQIPGLLIVTSALDCFDGSIERYQSWIDGGMFAMSMLLALHHYKIGAVPLNWSVLPEADRGLRSAGDIPDSERVIMLVGFGKIAQDALYCGSQRREVSEVMTHHEG